MYLAVVQEPLIEEANNLRHPVTYETMNPHKERRNKNNQQDINTVELEVRKKAKLERQEQRRIEKLYTDEEIDQIRIASWFAGWESRDKAEIEEADRKREAKETSDGWWTR